MSHFKWKSPKLFWGGGTTLSPDPSPVTQPFSLPTTPRSNPLQECLTIRACDVQINYCDTRSSLWKSVELMKSQWTPVAKKERYWCDSDWLLVFVGCVHGDREYDKDNPADDSSRCNPVRMTTNLYCRYPLCHIRRCWLALCHHCNNRVQSNVLHVN